MTAFLEFLLRAGADLVGSGILVAPFLIDKQREGGQRWRQCSCKWLEFTGGMYLSS